MVCSLLYNTLDSILLLPATRVIIFLIKILYCVSKKILLKLQNTFGNYLNNEKQHFDCANNVVSFIYDNLFIEAWVALYFAFSIWFPLFHFYILQYQNKCWFSLILYILYFPSFIYIFTYLTIFFLYSTAAVQFIQFQFNFVVAK